MTKTLVKLIHECKECNNLSTVLIINDTVTCPYCGTTNDVWFSKFSKAYLKHICKKYKNKKWNLIS